MKQLEKKIKNAEKEIKKYIDLLLLWQKHVNLISNKTIGEIWTRHVLDSAQLFYLFSLPAGTLIDVGSGGGFPGIILAILNKVNGFPIQKIILVESDLKKSLFLKEVNRQLDLGVEVLNERVEKVENKKADILVCRAFSELNQILTLCQKIVSRETICFFPKGKEVQKEIQACSIPCQIEILPSVISKESCILKIREVCDDN